MGRDRWSGRRAFVIAAIGSAVGLGNLWRFPFVAYKGGGGAFFIPYFVALFTAGIPLMIMEYGLGQLMQKAAPDAFKKIHPKFEFVGWWAVLVGTTISIYYAVVMAWCWVYTWNSFTIAWAGTEKDFFFKNILNLSSGPLEIGGIQIPILTGLVLTWVAVYFIICKGVRIVGKVVMWTVPLPVLLLVILFLRTITLPGAGAGIVYYLTPHWDKLKDPQVWLSAYSQIFFSLSLAFGILIAYASYKPEKSDITNDAFITSFANCFISFFAGFVVFSTLGFLAHTSGQDISTVVKGGPSLAFVTYPKAISAMPGGPIVQTVIGLTFFVTLLTLGIDSLFSIVEAVITALHDRLPVRRENVTLGFCIIACISGILFTTRSGLYWLDIVDHWMNDFGLAVVGLIECIVIGFFFDIAEFRKKINEVSEIKLAAWWDFFIRIVTPAILVFLITLSIHKEFTAPYGKYPVEALKYGGWYVVLIIIILSLILSRFYIPIVMFAIAALLYFVSHFWLAAPAALMFAFASVVLLGGLVTCLKIAGKNTR